MSNEDAEDERRLYECAKKYEQIVKQFDELIEMMNNRTTRAQKRRRLSSSGGGSRNAAASASASASAVQADNSEIFVHTITKFLDTLQPKTDVGCSKNTKNPEQQTEKVLDM